MKKIIKIKTDKLFTDITSIVSGFAADWAKDRLVGSTAHGVTADNKFMAAMNAAVGKYVSGGAKDNAGLAKDLAAAQAAVVK